VVPKTIAQTSDKIRNKGGGMNTESQSILSILFIVFRTALIAFITLSLPGLLFHRGFPLPWALALFGGFVTVFLLSHFLWRHLAK
jgi:hypothetical protein